VATFDIPGAFMQAIMEDLVHMKLEGKMAKLLVKLDPKLYRKHVYGTLKAALLFWRKLSAELKEWVFEINPYNWCVANKTIDGKQCTIL
jgi:hypothetical protein